MQYIREPRNQFPEMDTSPLKKIDPNFGIPEEFFELLEEAR